MFFFKFIEQQLNLRNHVNNNNNFEAKRWYLKLLIVLFNGFILTPACVMFWGLKFKIAKFKFTFDYSIKQNNKLYKTSRQHMVYFIVNIPG